MIENPYSALWQALRQDQQDRLPQGWRMGQVTRKAPLELAVDGLSLPARQLQTNSSLQGGFERGDQVLLLDTSGQGQSFLILCKVAQTE